MKSIQQSMFCRRTITRALIPDYGSINVLNVEKTFFSLYLYQKKQQIKDGNDDEKRVYYATTISL